jgi:hypothetical protein
MTKRTSVNPLVKIKVVPCGEGKWGVAGTLDGARTFINYVVGDRSAAEAEAERLERAQRDFNPNDSRS